MAASCKGCVVRTRISGPAVRSRVLSVSLQPRRLNADEAALAESTEVKDHPMPERPNLLFIFTDQQRADTMACYGNRMIETPNLNRLSDESFVFENAYVSAPICSPSRSTIMTGLWPHTSGVLKNNYPLDPSTP